MAPDSESHAGVVGDEALGLGHGSEGTWGLGAGGWKILLCEFRGFCVDRRFVKELSTWPDRAFGLPQGGPAVVTERIERADVGERDDFVAAQAGARDEIVQ